MSPHMDAKQLKEYEVETLLRQAAIQADREEGFGLVEVLASGETLFMAQLVADLASSLFEIRQDAFQTLHEMQCEMGPEEYDAALADATRAMCRYDITPRTFVPA